MKTNLTAIPAVSPLYNFTPLELETRSHVPTACAAFHLMRAEQTLRHWASSEAGAMRPIRINGRLAWNVAEIKSLLSGSPGISNGGQHERK